MTVYHAYQFMPKKDVETYYLRYISTVDDALQTRASQYAWSKGLTLPSSLVLVKADNPLLPAEVKQEREAAQAARPLLIRKVHAVNALSTVKNTGQNTFLATDVQHFDPVALQTKAHVAAKPWPKGKLTTVQFQSLNTNEQHAYRSLLLHLQAKRAEAIQRAIPKRCVQITRNKLCADPFSLSIDTLSAYRTPKAVFIHLPAYQKDNIEHRAQRELEPKTPALTRKDLSS